MLAKKMTYIDYDGNERTETFYFNLSKAEIIEMQLSVDGGMEKELQRMIDTRDVTRLAESFKRVILKAYGEKSPDGKRFIKSKELSEAFMQTEAYSDLFTELMSDANKAADFMNSIIPKVPDGSLEKIDAK